MAERENSIPSAPALPQAQATTSMSGGLASGSTNPQPTESHGWANGLSAGLGAIGTFLGGPAGTAIGALAGQAVGGLIDSHRNKKRTDDAREYNDAKIAEERAWQEEQYNKYQSPQALVEQYEKAGLNPASLSASGATAGVNGITSVGVGNPPTPSYVNPQGRDSYTSLLNQALSAERQSIDNLYEHQLKQNEISLGNVNVSLGTAKTASEAVHQETALAQIKYNYDALEANCAIRWRELDQHDTEIALNKTRFAFEKICKNDEIQREWYKLSQDDKRIVIDSINAATYKEMVDSNVDVNDATILRMDKEGRLITANATAQELRNEVQSARQGFDVKHAKGVARAQLRSLRISNARSISEIYYKIRRYGFENLRDFGIGLNAGTSAVANVIGMQNPAMPN